MSIPEMKRDEAWDLIPWLVNGTLSPDERRVVERYASNDADFAAEVAHQRQIAKLVQSSEVENLHQDDALRSIEDLLQAPKSARKWSWPRFSIWLVGGAVAAGLVVLMPMINQSQDFTTATSETEVVPASQVRIRVSPDVPFDEVAARLAELGAFDIEAPSEAGVIRANIPVERRDEVLLALRSDPMILFVATDEP